MNENNFQEKTQKNCGQKPWLESAFLIKACIHDLRRGTEGFRQEKQKTKSTKR